MSLKKIPANHHVAVRNYIQDSSAEENNLVQHCPYG